MSTESATWIIGKPGSGAVISFTANQVKESDTVLTLYDAEGKKVAAIAIPTGVKARKML